MTKKITVQSQLAGRGLVANIVKVCDEAGVDCHVLDAAMIDEFSARLSRGYPLKFSEDVAAIPRKMLQSKTGVLVFTSVEHAGEEMRKLICSLIINPPSGWAIKIV